MDSYDQYWNRNINEWAKFYLGISHTGESLKGPALFTKAYKASIGRYESKLMESRYLITEKFISDTVTKDSVFADLGCGTGLFTLAALRCGASVLAVDFAETALEATRKTVETQLPEVKHRVRYLKLDVRTEKVPASDVSLAVGLIPYISDISAFFDNSIAETETALVSFVDERNISNRLRKSLPFLNVRNLNFHSKSDVDDNWRKHCFQIDSRLRLGTGYIDIANRRKSQQVA